MSKRQHLINFKNCLKVKVFFYYVFNIYIDSNIDTTKGCPVFIVCKADLGY